MHVQNIMPNIGGEMDLSMITFKEQCYALVHIHECML